MTATRPTPIHYTGDARHLIATHEAGHAVAHLLLGHHVLDVQLGTTSQSAYAENYRGHTRYAGVDLGTLAELVGTGAGEAAVLHLLGLERHPGPVTIARATGEHDREYAARLVNGTTLPAGIATTLAGQILVDHWGAVERVADALRKAPDGRLYSAGVLAAASLGDTEIGWGALSVLADAAMPLDAGLRSYLTGPGLERESAMAGFLEQLRARDVLHSPATAPRRQVNAELFDRGMPEILAALDAASGGE